MNGTVWVVMCGTLGSWQLDSVWSSEEKAEEYMVLARKEYHMSEFYSNSEMVDPAVEMAHERA